jgi:hypothetical protein
MPSHRKFPDDSFLLQGLGSPPYLRCRELLMRFLSRTSVDIILPRACQEAGIDPLILQPADLPTVVQQLSPGMRLFCKPQHLTQLMLELADLLLEE